MKKYYIEITDEPKFTAGIPTGKRCRNCKHKLPPDQDALVEIYKEIQHWYCSDECWVPELRT